MEPAAARLARRFLEEHWCDACSSASLDRARLLVSELVSNAVRYGGAPVTLAVDCVGAEGVLVAVSDGSRDFPILRQVQARAEGGRGVHLVDSLSAEWGVEFDPRPDGRQDGATPAVAPGKTVWCRLTV